MAQKDRTSPHLFAAHVASQNRHRAMWKLWEAKPFFITTRCRWTLLLCSLLATCDYTTNDHQNRLRYRSPHSPTVPRPPSSSSKVLDYSGWHGDTSGASLGQGVTERFPHSHRPTHRNHLCASNNCGHSDLQCIYSWHIPPYQALRPNLHSHILASHTKSRNWVTTTSTLLSPSGFRLRLLPPPPNRTALLRHCYSHLQGLQHTYLPRAHRRLCTMRPWTAMPLLCATHQKPRRHSIPWQRPYEDRQDGLYPRLQLLYDRALLGSTFNTNGSLVSQEREPPSEHPSRPRPSTQSKSQTFSLLEWTKRQPLQLLSCRTAAASLADLTVEPTTSSRVLLAPTQLFSNAPVVDAAPALQPTTDARGSMHLPSTPAGLGDVVYLREETTALHPVTGSGSGSRLLRRHLAMPFSPLTPPDAIPRSLVGFGHLVAGPTVAQLPEHPHYASDAWEDHISEVQGSASGSMSATNTPVAPTESQLRVQPFTPAIPTEFSHHAGLLTLDGACVPLLANPPASTPTSPSVRHPHHNFSARSLFEEGHRLFTSNSQENRVATHLTSTEEFPRVGSPEGLAGARIAVAAALAHNRRRHSIPYEMAIRPNADDYD